MGQEQSVPGGPGRDSDVESGRSNGGPLGGKEIVSVGNRGSERLTASGGQRPSLPQARVARTPGSGATTAPPRSLTARAAGNPLPQSGGSTPIAVAGANSGATARRYSPAPTSGQQRTPQPCAAQQVPPLPHRQQPAPAPAIGGDQRSTEKNKSEEEGSCWNHNVLPRALLLPHPFAHPVILVLLLIGLAGVAYPIAQAWTRVVAYHKDPAVRTLVQRTSAFPRLAAVFCPLPGEEDDTTPEIAVHVYAGFVDSSTSSSSSDAASTSPAISSAAPLLFPPPPLRPPSPPPRGAFETATYLLPFNAASMRDLTGGALGGALPPLLPAADGRYSIATSAAPQTPSPPHAGLPPSSGADDFQPRTASRWATACMTPQQYDIANVGAGAVPNFDNSDSSGSWIQSYTLSNGATYQPRHGQVGGYYYNNQGTATLNPVSVSVNSGFDGNELPSGGSYFAHSATTHSGSGGTVVRMPSGDTGNWDTAGVGCRVAVPFVPIAAAASGNSTSGGSNSVGARVEWLSGSIHVTIFACGGPRIVITSPAQRDDDGGPLVIADISGADFKQPQVNQACGEQVLDPTTLPTVRVAIDISPSFKSAQKGANYTAWRTGYIVSLGCAQYSSRCLVYGSAEVMVGPGFDPLELFSSAGDLRGSATPAATVTRLTAAAAAGAVPPTLFGLVSTADCWQVTQAAPFASTDALDGLFTPSSLQIGLKAPGGVTVAYAFFPADDPAGVATLETSSAFELLQTTASTTAFSRLAAAVTRTLRPYTTSPEALVRDVAGVGDRDAGNGAADPWPPSAADAKQFLVAAQVRQTGLVMWDSGAPPVPVKCTSGGPGAYGPENCITWAYAYIYLAPGMMNYDVDVSEEYYPFGDADAVQTMATYLPLIPEILIPSLIAIPLLASKAARWRSTRSTTATAVGRAAANG